ncbi:MAG TPA: hypothetical protein VLA71_16330 [Algoriphagus sp.]|nr:hypothetical protein [Algoriphagus sp.]
MLTARNVKSLIGLWGLALVFLVSSCTQFEGTDPSKDSDLTNSEITDNTGEGGDLNAFTTCEGPDVPPTVFTGGSGGNVSCSDVCNFGYTSGRNDFVDGAFVNPWPEGFTVNVHKGTTVSWSFDPPEGYCLNGITVIVKGGPSANIYNYGPGVTSDCGLVSPKTSSGKPAALSNLTFCYDLVEIPEPPVSGGDQDDCIENGCLTATVGELPDGVTVVWYDNAEDGNVVENPTLCEVGEVTYWAEAVLFGGCVSETRTPVTLTLEDCDEDDGGGGDDDPNCGEETAFGGGTNGKLDGVKGAWWFYFDTDGLTEPTTQTIYAGQVATDGTVTYDPVEDSFTLNLGSWSLNGDAESVKVQGFDALPETRPAAGLFTTYKGNELEFDGDGSRYYVIHLDLIKECPE